MAHDIVGINPLLQVHSLEKAVRFFVDALGFEYSAGRGLRAGKVSIHLVKGDEQTAQSTVNKRLLLRVSDVEALRERALRAGYQATELDNHKTFCVVEGPENYRVELFQFRY